MPQFNPVKTISDTKQIAISTKTGDLAVNTPRTAAVCSIGRRDLKAGPLAVSGVTAFCNVSASAMDGKGLVNSKKILVLHITDVLNSEMTFTNDKMTDTKSWGKLPYLARCGEAKIALKNNNANLAVYALASDGTRLRKVASSYRQGEYLFTAKVAPGEGGNAPTMIYEIAP